MKEAQLNIFLLSPVVLAAEKAEPAFYHYYTLSDVLLYDYT